MPPVLTLLDGVRWHGAAVVGERPQALLAALVLDGTRAVSDERLVAEVWGDDVPANPAKALQVLVSRTRAACGHDAVARESNGYRIGVLAQEVDALLLAEQTTTARRALDAGDHAGARAAATTAVELGRTVAEDASSGPLAAVRRGAAEQARMAAEVLGQALSGCGDHAAALPLLEHAHARRPDDESILASLLRSESLVRGAGGALDRYAAYRSRLRARLGTDPGGALQRVHQELLAQDRPVRAGVLYDATSLVGREDDIEALRAVIGSGRVTSIVGAGGLGKTRLAHVLARQAEQPVVHFVELVGVTAEEDVVSEVGSALGVRDSVSGRRALTPQQRADVRSRIVSQLDTAPTLLVLDNCEHLVAAVAELVAFLVASTRDLRVVTTTRAPLGIAAERVYLLGQLDLDDAVALFGQRAVAARASVVLEQSAVTELVTRLDGLPLAIELAAAKVRVMSVGEIGRRLENRFALLRGDDRGAPDRHRTLLAVIDWSWNLLEERERHALRWLSVFHDGFGLSAAERVLGTQVDALAAVQNLVDQSLLSVHEDEGSVRYRMLETVREFGRMQLVDAGEDALARRAQRRWAVELADQTSTYLYGPRQIECMDLIRADEANLADVLRQAVGDSDPESVIALMAALGGFWSVTGDHPRVFTLAEGIARAVVGWRPPPGRLDQTRLVLAMIVSNSSMFYGNVESASRTMLEELGAESEDSRIRGLVTLVLGTRDHDGNLLTDGLNELIRHPSREVRTLALQWSSHLLENAGDPDGAIAATTQALDLWCEEDGPWAQATLRTQLAQMEMQIGNAALAEEHARAALPMLERLRATDDVIQLKALIAVADIAAGRMAEAEAAFDSIVADERHRAVFGGAVVVATGRAELAIAKGEIEEGLRLYRDAVVQLRALRFPGLVGGDGFEPWTLFGEAAAATAYAVHAEAPAGAELHQEVLTKARRFLSSEGAYFDYPVAGLLLFALGTWGVRRAAVPLESAARLVVLAEGFAYNRTTPTMALANAADPIEAAAPGLLEKIRKEYAGWHGPQLREEGRAVLAEL